MVDDISHLSNLKEGLNVEFKESLTKVPESFYETYSSFSNTDGGVIYLGIKEGRRNTIVGVQNPIEQKKAIISALHSKEKVSYCSVTDEDIQILDIDGKKVIKVNVSEAPREVKPVYIKGNLSLSYERVGDGDFQMSEECITNSLIDRRQIRFDSLPNPFNFDFSRIDMESLKDYRSYLNEISPNNIYRSLDDHDFLVRIGAFQILDNGKEVLTNGAVFFFGYITDIMRLSPNFFLDYQENISGSSRWDYRLVSDDMSLNSNIYNFFKIVSQRLIQNVPNPFKTNGVSNMNGNDLKRSIVEALVNAITNQDYLSLPGLVVKKSMSSIAMMNSGDVLTGIEQAIRGGISEPRNRNIMNYFRIIQVSDRAGTGVPSIFHTFKSYQFPTPELLTKKNPLRTELYMSFLQLPMNTLYREEKLKILAALDNHPEGLSSNDISVMIEKKNTVTIQILNELFSLGLLCTNGKKTKGRMYYKIGNEKSIQ